MGSPVPNQLNEVLARLAQQPTDETSWIALYRILRPYIFLLCRSVLGRFSNLAEDACQEAFLKIVRFAPIGQFGESRSIYPYIRMVVRSVCADLHTAQKQYEPLDEGLVVSEMDNCSGRMGLFGVGELPADLTQAEVDLLEALAKGHSVEEIAAQFGISYSNAGIRMHRLRKKFRTSLNIK